MRITLSSEHYSDIVILEILDRKHSQLSVNKDLPYKFQCCFHHQDAYRSAPLNRIPRVVCLGGSGGVCSCAVRGEVLLLARGGGHA